MAEMRPAVQTKELQRWWKQVKDTWLCRDGVIEGQSVARAELDEGCKGEQEVLL